MIMWLSPIYEYQSGSVQLTLWRYKELRDYSIKLQGNSYLKNQAIFLRESYNAGQNENLVIRYVIFDQGNLSADQMFVFNTSWFL
jgi:hypothetical protein